MVRKRYSDDGKTNQSQSNHSYRASGSDDSNEREAIKGFKKLLFLILFFTAIFLCRAFVVDVVCVSGNSMNPTLIDGEYLAMNPKVDSLERGDIVVAKIDGFRVIKRVVALPKETIHVQDGKIYIDGVLLEEEYAIPNDFAGTASVPLVMGEEEYYLMGDNRGESEDSRVYGGVNFEKIQGVVTYRIYPFDVVGSLKNAKGSD